MHPKKTCLCKISKQLPEFSLTYFQGKLVPAHPVSLSEKRGQIYGFEIFWGLKKPDNSIKCMFGRTSFEN